MAGAEIRKGHGRDRSELGKVARTGADLGNVMGQSEGNVMGTMTYPSLVLSRV